MEFYFLVAVLMVLGAATCWGSGISQPRPSDFELIERYSAARGLKVDKTRKGGNHWRYWLQGNLKSSNVARIYVIEAETPDGRRIGIHVAVDPMCPGELKLLEERELRGS